MKPILFALLLIAVLLSNLAATQAAEQISTQAEISHNCVVASEQALEGDDEPLLNIALSAVSQILVQTHKATHILSAKSADSTPYLARAPPQSR